MKTLLKFLTLAVIASGFFSAASAQDDDKPVSVYVFPEFKPAVVKREDIKPTTMLLNYNTFTREMVYIQNGQYNAFYIGSADTIFFNDRPFIPGDKEFLEVGTKTAVPLLVEYRCELSLPSASSGFGMKSSETISVDHVTPDVKQQLYDLKLPANYTLNPQVNLFLKKGGQMLKANNLKQVQAVFPTNADKIKAYAKSNSINFDKVDDVKKLIVYCNSLPN